MTRRKPPTKAEVKAAADRAEGKPCPKQKSNPKPRKQPVRKSPKKKETSQKPTTQSPDAREKPDDYEFGRPTDYKEEYVEQVKKLCDLGATNEEIAAFFGVSTRTIDRWKLKYEDFCRAIKNGKEIPDERIERSLYQKATGYYYIEKQVVKVKVDQHTDKVEIVEVEKYQPADTTAMMFWLKNRRADKWRERKSTEFTGADGGPIEIKSDEGDIDTARKVAYMLGEAMGKVKGPTTAKEDEKAVTDDETDA